MSGKPSVGWRRPAGGGGLRSTLQQAQEVADLATAALLLPPLGRCKPLLLAQQLRPVLLLLERLDSSGGSSSEDAGVEGQEEEQGTAAAAAAASSTGGEQHGDASPAGSGACNEAQKIAAAAMHLRRLVQVDVQRAANEYLLFCLLLELALVAEGDGEEGHAAATGAARRGSGELAVWRTWRLSTGNFLSLVEAVGWEGLLRAALMLEPGAAMLLLWQCTAEAAATLPPPLHTLLLAPAAELVSSQLEGAAATAAAGPSSAAGAELGALAGELGPLIEVLEAHLLELQAAEPSATVAEAPQFQRLAAAADAAMRSLLSLTQQPGWGPEHQRLFQLLCQLRARLALLLGAEVVPSAPLGAPSSGPGSWGGSVGGMPEGSPREAWRAVLELQPRASGDFAAAGPVPAAAPLTSCPVFLAAHLAAWRLLSAGSWGGGGALPASEQPLSAPATPPPLAEPPLRFATHIRALSGVTFPPPTIAADSLATAGAGAEAGPAEKAAQVVTRDLNPLGPAGLALAALQRAQEMLALGSSAEDSCQQPGAAGGEASESSRGSNGAAAAAPAVLALVWLALGAAGRVEERPQQQALLDCVLCSPQLAQLRGWLGRSAVLQEWCRRGLLAMSNRLADDGSSVRVFGDERQRVATLVREGLPWALLAPAAALERLLVDALTQAGQARAVVDALAEMPALAYYSSCAAGPAPAAPTHLTACLAACITDAPSECSGAGPAAAPITGPAVAMAFASFAPPSLRDSPAARRAYLGLAALLCSTPAGQPGQSSRPLVDPATLLCHSVLPALTPGSIAQPGGPPHPMLSLALELACSVLGCWPGSEPGSAGGAMPAPSGEQWQPAARVLLLSSDAPSSGSGGGAGERSLAAQLLAPLLALLDSSQRQLRVSPTALLTPLECYSLARALAERVIAVLAAAAEHGSGEQREAAAAAAAAAAASCAALSDAWLHLQPLTAVLGPAGSSDSSLGLAARQQLHTGGSVGRLLELYAAHEAVAAWADGLALGSQQQQHASQLLAAVRQLPLPELRQELVQACAQLLPTCTPAEAARVLGSGLPLLVAVAAGGASSGVPAPVQLALTEAAVLEVACRALPLLALDPAACPIAGEAVGGAEDEQQQAAAAAAAAAEAPSAGGPSALRQIAVERCMRHISAYCQDITAAAAAALAPSGAQEEGADVAAAAAATAGLAGRCFREVCRAAAAVQPFYACATLQVCLLHLIQVVRRCEGGALSEPSLAALQQAAAKLQGGLGETVCFALEPQPN